MLISRHGKDLIDVNLYCNWVVLKNRFLSLWQLCLTDKHHQTQHLNVLKWPASNNIHASWNIPQFVDKDSEHWTLNASLLRALNQQSAPICRRVWEGNGTAPYYNTCLLYLPYLCYPDTGNVTPWFQSGQIHLRRHVMRNFFVIYMWLQSSKFLDGDWRSATVV